jgi:hypothetical protein
MNSNSQQKTVIEGAVKIYFDAMMKLLRPSFDQLLANDDVRKKIGKSLENTIYETENSISTSNFLSEKEEFVHFKILKPFGEIVNSWESLVNIPIYLSSFPFKKNGIKFSSYLRYHVENHLHEIYVLKERLISYINIIMKKYKQSLFFQDKIPILKLLDQSVISTLEPIINSRGRHVHQERFEDQRIERLSTIELLMSGDDLSFKNDMEAYYNLIYKDIRKEWVQIVRSNNNSIKIIILYYFEALNEILLLNNNFILPDDIRS